MSEGWQSDQANQEHISSVPSNHFSLPNHEPESASSSQLLHHYVNTFKTQYLLKTVSALSQVMPRDLWIINSPIHKIAAFGQLAGSQSMPWRATFVCNVTRKLDRRTTARASKSRAIENHRVDALPKLRLEGQLFYQFVLSKTYSSSCLIERYASARTY